jgi:hypothetical protein
MTNEACFDWTLLTDRGLEGLVVRERVVRNHRFYRCLGQHDPDYRLKR